MSLVPTVLCFYHNSDLKVNTSYLFYVFLLLFLDIKRFIYLFLRNFYDLCSLRVDDDASNVSS